MAEEHSPPVSAAASPTGRRARKKKRGRAVQGRAAESNGDVPPEATPAEDGTEKTFCYEN